MWNLDVDKIPHPHISSEVDPIDTRPLAVESDESFKRHHRFFFTDDNVVFQVEHTRFKIHRYFFQRDSEIFAAVFALPGGPGYGASDYSPIRLVDIRVKDFEIFLSVLYPPKFGVYAVTNVDEWSSVLDLAAKWKFESIKALAIEKLAVLASPIDKIVLGRMHNITEWLIDAYKAVCEQPSALTLEEARKLGMEDVVKISFLRQEIRTASFGFVKASVDVVSAVFGLDERPPEVSPVNESEHDQCNQAVSILDKQSPAAEKLSLTPEKSPVPSHSHFVRPTPRSEESLFSFHRGLDAELEGTGVSQEIEAQEDIDWWGISSKKKKVTVGKRKK